MTNEEQILNILNENKSEMTPSNWIKPGYTRVSEFCSRYEDFGSVDPAYLRHRADVGSEVHAGIRGFLCDVPVILSSEAQPYFDSWLAWYELMGMPPVTHEETRMYCDKWKLTGAIDGIIQFDGKQPMVVDWKTSSSIDNDISPLKGAFYQYLVKVNELVDTCDTVAYVKLDKHGGPAKLCEYEITPQLKGLATATMMTYRFEERVKQNKQNWRQQ